MKLKRMFWSHWLLSYLNILQSGTKWMHDQKELTVRSLVLIKNPASFSTRWTPGRIVATHTGADGICRVVTIQTSSGVMTRSVSQVAVLPLPPSSTSSRPPEDVDSFRRPEMAPRTGTFFILEVFVIGGKMPFDSDEAHFWLNGCVNKQNCRIWSEANPQVYVETPLHPEKLTVWGALWAGGILLQKR
ncbi:hypothetical protein TNCV_1226311 [Trichonephila clavipes]|nr:hypothetical protein TNCV_1226311 [Trichonephila clavipes]